MKKSLVVVALAGAMAFTAASAETVLYGSIRLGAEVAKNHYSAETNAAGEIVKVNKNKRGLAMEDFGSRVGLKGSEDLGNGAKVLFQAEFGFDGMSGGKGFSNELRLAWIGVQGEWGTVALGRQNNPFTESLNADTEADQFNGNYTSALRIATGAVVFGADMPTRVGNSIAYVSPSFSGFNFVVAGITEVPELEKTTTFDANTGKFVSAVNAEGTFNGKGNKNKGFDIYTVGLNYEHESGFYAKAAYIGADLYKDQKRANAYGLNVGFANEQFGVNADFAGASKGRKGDTGVKTTSTAWDLGGHFSFGPDYFSTVRATVGQSEVKYKTASTNKNKVTVWAVGFEQKLSTRTKVWVEYAKENNKWKAANVPSVKNNTDAFSVGIRHDF